MKETAPRLRVPRPVLTAPRRRQLRALIGPLGAAGAGSLTGLVAGLALLAQQPAQVEATMLVAAAAPPTASLTRTPAADSLADRVVGETRHRRRFARYRSLLTARPAARALQAKPALVRALFPGRWNSRRQAWQAPGPAAALWAPLARWLGYGRPSWAPTTAELRSRLASALRIRERGQAGLVAVSFRHARAAVARRVLATVQQAASQRLAQVAARDSRATIAGLRNRLAAAAGRHHREALAELLRRYEAAHIKQDSTASYAARVVSAPASSPAPRYPRPVLVAGGFTLAGAAAGTAAYVARLRRRRQGPAP